MTPNRRRSVAVFLLGAVVASTCWFAWDRLAQASGRFRRCSSTGRDAVVLVVGDSLAWDAASEAERFNTVQGSHVSVIVRAEPGTGLINGFDWVAEMQRLVDEIDPDVVVAEFVGNYFPPYATDATGGDIAPDSSAFYERWAQRAEAATAALGARQAHVYWVLGPHMRDPDLDRRRLRLDTVYLSLQQSWPDVRYLDGYGPLSGPDLTYTDTLPDSSGAPEQIRAADGIHLTEAGSRRLVQAAAEAVAADLASSPCRLSHPAAVTSST